MIKEVNALTQQNQVLQESVNALQKDQAEKDKVGSDIFAKKHRQQGVRRTVAN